MRGPQGQPAKPPPKDFSATELMEQKLQTDRGRGLYKLGGQTVEPVFGQIKDARGIDKFTRRGFEA
ncbi:MAG: DDE transposase, partial [Planctomycetota bacterium]